MINWSVNLTMLFNEVPFLERFQAAAVVGFQAVEFLWPNGVDLDAIVAAKEASGVEVALLNINAGDMASGDRGLTNNPKKKAWRREQTEITIGLAARLKARRINALAGNKIPGLSHDEMIDCLCDNLTWAVPKSEAHGITLMLEPLNRFESPRYLLGRIADATDVIDRLNSPTVRLQFDIYHTQRTEGNLVKLLEVHIEKIGHIQIADSPNRNQLGTGEINWPFLLGQIERLGYTDFVGLEYVPLPNTKESLNWLPDNKRGQCRADELNL